MKTFNKQALPKTVSYLGETYYLNSGMSSAMSANKTSPTHIAAELKKQGRKVLIVKVLHRNLRGKLDLHGKPYQPTEWLFTTNAKVILAFSCIEIKEKGVVNYQKRILLTVTAPGEPEKDLMQIDGSTQLWYTDKTRNPTRPSNYWLDEAIDWE